MSAPVDPAAAALSEHDSRFSFGFGFGVGFANRTCSPERRIKKDSGTRDLRSRGVSPQRAGRIPPSQGAALFLRKSAAAARSELKFDGSPLERRSLSQRICPRAGANHPPNVHNSLSHLPNSPQPPMMGPLASRFGNFETHSPRQPRNRVSPFLAPSGPSRTNKSGEPRASPFRLAPSAISGEIWMALGLSQIP